MKRYALYHIEEELYLNDYMDGEWELDSNLCLFTQGELEYIFTDDETDEHFGLEFVYLSDGTECKKSDFELVEYNMIRGVKINFGDYTIDDK